MATDVRSSGQATTLTAAQICDRLQISRWTLQKLRDDPGFPKPIIAIHNCIRWAAADIDQWINGRVP